MLHQDVQCGGPLVDHVVQELDDVRMTQLPQQVNLEDKTLQTESGYNKSKSMILRFFNIFLHFPKTVVSPFPLLLLNLE